VVVIRKIARWILLFASLAFVVPFPSDAKEQMAFGSVLVSILMVVLALDMLLLILRVPRKRLQVLLEFGLYPTFIILSLFQLFSRKALACLMSNELNALGERVSFLTLFVGINGVLIASALVVLIDAKNAMVCRGEDISPAKQ